MKISEIKVGDTVWSREHWSGTLFSGIVTGVKYSEPSEKYPEPIPYVEFKSRLYGITERKLEDVYPTKAVLVAALHEETETYKKEIKSKIHDVNDLVRFMYNHPITTGSEEYCDWEARAAVAEIAKEMLNIDLEEEN